MLPAVVAPEIVTVLELDTVVPVAIPVPETLEPTEIVPLTLTIDTAFEPAVVTVEATAVVVRYVGTRVGDTVGADVGRQDGWGVGLPGTYVGTLVT